MKNIGNSKFGERLKELRLKNKLSYNNLSNILQVNRATLYDWENRGKEPPYLMLIKIAKFFNTKIDYLLGITNTD